ncbi:MAG: FtsL-like putative cell division protein [Ferruginibacter sp.]
MAEQNTNKENKKKRADRRKAFNYNRIVKNIPFFLFLAVLAVLYIYNGHHADKLVRKIAATEKNIKELEYEYKTVKSDLIFRSKASELVKAVEPLGLREPKLPPMLLGETDNNALKDTVAR